MKNVHVPFLASARAVCNSRIWFAAITGVLISASALEAQTTTWDAGGGASTDWQLTASDDWLNWTTDTTPAGKNVVFNDTAGKGTSATVGNVVNTDFTLESLSYTNTGSTASDWQVTDIESSVTLTLAPVGTPTNVLLVGGFTGADTATRAKITGDGALVVNAPTSNILVGNRGANGSKNSAQLDMSGLASFTATVNNFTLGGTGANNLSGSVRLARANTITATTLAVGGGTGGSNIQSDLYLGASNELNVDSILVGSTATGANNTSGTMRFDPETGAGRTVRIRAKDGTGAASFAVAKDASSGSVAHEAFADFTAGSIDALFSTLSVGDGTLSSVRTSFGGFSMLNGSVTSANVDVGFGRGVGEGSVTRGVLNILGGDFDVTGILTLGYISDDQDAYGAVNISGNSDVTLASLRLGRHRGDAIATNSFAAMNVTGGRVTMGSNIAEASDNNRPITSILNLSGGELNMAAHAIIVDQASFESGSLRNVTGVTVNSVAGLTKTGGAGILHLAGTNTYTGGTTINAGTLVADAGSLVSGGADDITVNAGGALALNFTGIQSTLNDRVVESSAGSIALTTANATEDIDFSASGANLANAFLGAVDRVTYTGNYTPYGSSYRLGGGLGTLNYANDLTGASAVEIGGGPGIVELSGTNDYTGGTTLRAGTLRLTSNNDLGGASGDGALSFNGGGLQWASGVTDDITSGRSVTLGAGGGTFDTNGNSVTLASAMAGTGALTKTGANALRLVGTNLNSAGITAHQGTLTLDAGAFASTPTVTFGGGTISALSSQNLGDVTWNTGTSSTLVVSSGATVTLGDTWTRPLASSLLIDLSDGGIVSSQPITSVTTQASTDTILGNVVVRDGSGYDFGIVQNDNIVRYTAAITASGSVGGGTNYKVGAGSITLTDGNRSMGSLRIDTSGGSGSLTGNAIITVGNILMTGSGDYTINASKLGYYGAPNMLLHHYGTGVLTLNAPVGSDNLYPGSFTMGGTGTVVLERSNSVSLGSFSVLGGVLSVSNITMGTLASSIGISSNDASNLLLNGGTLRYTGTGNTTDRNFTVGGNGGRIEASGTGSLVWGGSMVASATSGSQTFTLGGTSTAANTFSGLINDGAGSVTAFTKDGVGTWVVNNSNNSYTGATMVSEGTLIIDGALTRTSGVTVEAAGALGGHGTINSSLTLAAASDLTMDLNSAVAITGYDQLTVSGAISLDGANLVLALNYAPVEDATFTLLNNTGDGAIAGLFATVNGVALVDDAFTLTYNGNDYDFELSYTGGDGNDLVIQAVPEPSTWALLIIGGVLVLTLRRRHARV